MRTTILSKSVYAISMFIVFISALFVLFFPDLLYDIYKIMTIESLRPAFNTILMLHLETL
jgi:hypothetical protein